jgi:GAF domain-containing protein/HAMP domain-containing protein
MNTIRDTHATLNSDQRSGTALWATVRYIPLLTGLLALGLLAAYALSRTGLLGDPAPQLLTLALITAMLALAHFPVVALIRAGRATVAYGLFALIMGAWAASLVLLWEAAAPVAVLIAWIASLAGMAAGIRRKHLAFAALFSAAATAAVLWINTHPWLSRLSGDSPSGLAAVVLLASTVVLFVLGTIVVRIIPYGSLQSRLVVSFILIITVPVLFITAISAITAYNNSQNQFGNTLQAISALKQQQVDATVQSIALEMADLREGTGRAASILHILDRTGETEESYQLRLSLSSILLRDFINQYPASHFEEVLVLDTEGKVVLSTEELDDGLIFAHQPFFTAGSRDFYAEMQRFDGKKNSGLDYKLVAAAPFFDETGKAVRGVIVAVANKDIVFSIMGPTAGLSNAQTYLVGGDRKVLTDATKTRPVTSALPILHLIVSKVSEGVNPYVNHEGRSVLGFSTWDRTINAAFVAEVPRQEVLNKSLSTLFVSGLVGLFTIVVAVITAISTSRAISDPIRALAGAAASLTSGDLTARATADRRDEIGTLAGSFNNMAGQLQGVIGNLEQRIAERTQALEQQTVRLRAAAEVARDAANAVSLDELLEQAARLIRDRFDLYHTGIFLLDEKKEFAVLRATPSEEGAKMLENQHRLRVGEQGIVGRVAATGEPRIALDTGVDPVYFNNPLLPKTHSEMALPLKTADGVIGVIDIQSEQREAFTQDDIAIVQVMADQLATAIQRTRLLQQVQLQVSQLEQSQQDFTKHSWRVFQGSGRQHVGYKFDNIRLESVKTLPEDARSVFEKGEAARSNGGGTSSLQHINGQTLAVPIRLRGQTIGVVNLRFSSARPPQATAAMIDQIADRLATALENARLLEDSMRRANKERAIGEISSKISASVNMRNVLQTAVEELGRAIPGSEVLIQLQTDPEI